MSDDDFTFLAKMVLRLAGIIDITYAGVAGVEAVD